jgi:GT2 family glycosyltransferase
VSAAVGVVVVNFNGGEVTLDCLRSIFASDWPVDALQVVLVDNASSDGIVDRVRSELPSVWVEVASSNRGFGAGCNIGIRALLDHRPDIEHIALVNNDALVEPGWLSPLVAALDDDPAVGATCPKIVFKGRFETIDLQAPTYRRGGGDRRELGVLVHGARVDDNDVWPRIQLVEGFWGVEPGAGEAQWSGGSARLRVPTPFGGAMCSLLLSGPGAARVELQSAAGPVRYDLMPQPAWYDVPLAGPGEVIVNNAGVDLGPYGFASDRGYQEPDDARWNESTDLDAWCGGAVLLRRDYLASVGLFDEELFLYYEDVELSMRGAARGWRYRYVPVARVEHLHSASAGKGSAFKRYYDERNRLLILARHARSGEVVRASVRSLLVTGSYARRDLVAPLLTRGHAHPGVVAERIRAFCGFARRLPATIASRSRAAQRHRE